MLPLLYPRNPQRRPAHIWKCWTLLGLTLLSCGGPQPASSVPAVAPKAVDFAARDLGGRTFRLSDHLGQRVILLVFWATWSKPSLSELTHLRRMYAERQTNFLVIGVCVDGPETIAEAPSFAKRNDLTFPIVLDEDSHIVSLYNPKRDVPLSVLFDKHGRIFRVHSGYNPGDETELQADLAEALGQD